MLTTLVGQYNTLIITFGDRTLSKKACAQEIVIGLLVLMPVGFVVGFIVQRFACRVPAGVRRLGIRPDLWNTVLKLLIADGLMEFILPSTVHYCVPVEDDSRVGFTYKLWSQAWGNACPQSPVSRVNNLTPAAAGFLFLSRLLTVALGIYFGESLCPLAVTGGIACGKTTVVDILKKPKQEEGDSYFVDADTIAHQILLKGAPDSVYDKIIAEFGTGILKDGGSNEIDRLKLGAIVFDNKAKRRALNGITHPRILYIMLKRLFWGIFCSSEDMVMADIPLLFESGKLRFLFALVIVVSTSKELQLERLLARNPELNKEQAQQRIDSQLPLDQKEKLGDIVIRNEGINLDELEDQVKKVRQECMNRLYGFGLSLLQLILIIGGSVPVAVMSKLYALKAAKHLQGG